MRRQRERQKKTAIRLISIKNDFACEHTFLYISLQLLLQDYHVNFLVTRFMKEMLYSCMNLTNIIETSVFLFAFFFTAAHFYLTGH